MLTGANVIVKHSYLATSSDSKGNFVLKFPKPGTYTLLISYLGYENYEETFKIEKDVNLTIKLIPRIYLSDEVIISAIRAGGNSLTTYGILDEMQIEEKNTGKDLPYILQSLPSTVVSSDAGAGVGYTGIRIRGTGLTGINVTLNGVPVNDPESHAVYFVDLPDLASSLDDIRVQRGVGTSTNGAASFGASINMKSGNMRSKAYAEANSAAGSYHTFKNTVKFGSGLLKEKWTVDGRLSWINSDGYVNRAFADLFSGQITFGYYGKKDILKFFFLEGREKTYQAWEGTPKDSLETNRKYNPAGKIEDAEGNITGYYNDQTDNYRQTYYQLHYAHEFNQNLNLATSFFYTKGKGFYQSYKNNKPFSDYGWNDTIIGNDTISSTSLIDQDWLDNDFYGVNLSLNYNAGRAKINLGTGLNQYSGDHFGKVIWAQIAMLGEYDQKYYFNNGLKTEFNVFAKIDYPLFEKFNFYADLQYRKINYNIAGTDEALADVTQLHRYNFFNPKAGLFYYIDSQNSLYFSVAIANREPNRSVFVDADNNQAVLPEKLYDYELGYQLESNSFSVQANLFYMDYKNQLVMTGKINNVGTPVLTNVPESYRVGLELQAGIRFLKIFSFSANATFSSNKIENFVAYTDDWTNWPIQVSDTIGRTDISFSPSITAIGNLSVEPLKKFKIVLNSNYVGKQYIDNTSNKNRSLSPYFVTNLNFYYSLKTNFISEIGILFSLNNIFNAKYVSNAWVYPYYYDSVEYELNGYYPQAEFNFMVGISLKL
jgi:iron complex outermembrane receptor protein